MTQELIPGLTDKQIYDLNNSMTAAQNVNLGTVISGLMAGELFKVSSKNGNAYIAGIMGYPTEASITLDTDLMFGNSEVTFDSVVCSLSGSPMPNHFMSTTTIDVSGSVVTIEQWGLNSGSFVSSASSGDFVPISIIAYGNISEVN